MAAADCLVCTGDHYRGGRLRVPKSKVQESKSGALLDS